VHSHDGFVVFAYHTVSLLSDIPSGVRVPPVANLENIPFQNSWPLSEQDLLLFLLLQLTDSLTNRQCSQRFPNTKTNDLGKRGNHLADLRQFVLVHEFEEGNQEVLNFDKVVFELHEELIDFLQILNHVFTFVDQQ